MNDSEQVSAKKLKYVRKYIKSAKLKEAASIGFMQ